MQSSAAVKRILKEVAELAVEGDRPGALFTAAPLETDLFEMHFTVRGPPETAFEGGLYHGRILLPPEYPLKVWRRGVGGGRGFVTGMRATWAMSSLRGVIYRLSLMGCAFPSVGARTQALTWIVPVVLYVRSFSLLCCVPCIFFFIIGSSG